ncbi:hypothetical protein O6H91_02G012700 [Diphasiastrum complanatum]|uniref:Uncharacterized protein n=1 Tax=Diphasiastrum complanatum TaxID=34168 RepID=A0ACC2ECW5_DIPCM|nr:hypothetical protein O6H91_02G012700 [Diphasiastrum complanatum]
MQLLTAILMVFFLTSYVQGGVESEKKVVRLHWYMHDTIYSGPNSSSIAVTGSSDFLNEIANNLLGQIYVFDDPLTLGSSLTSEKFGRSQGTYFYVSREEIVGCVSYTVSIQTGKYNGSTLNIFGANPNSRVIKEYSIVGGTGDFLLGRGILREEVVNLFGPFGASATVSHNATIYLD